MILALRFKIGRFKANEFDRFIDKSECIKLVGGDANKGKKREAAAKAAQ